ncbi:limbic system-associated membrane protein-like [Nothobranchius furzeri]|uniref:Limbic system-associated membrane protein-like n=1 Tax=Nothobranchius furzeri TaxID=105023 RepID=A0A9D2XBP9_NOTFU|nr:limbic system-associated membrane protein-like [Nothobranchius furzeri]
MSLSFLNGFFFNVLYVPLTLSCSSYYFNFLSLCISVPLTAAEPLGGEEYLDVIGITRNQAGRYECKASNDVAMPDVKYVNVVVNYTPTIKKTQSSETPVGRMGMLQCEAVAMPTPEFEWYRDENR